MVDLEQERQERENEWGVREFKKGGGGDTHLGFMGQKYIVS